MTTGAEPLRAARHARSRSWSVSDECSTASGASKRAAKRATSCGVRAISGTSTRACSPRATTSSIARRYTSVLPLPVTPCSRNDAYAPCAAAIASIAVRWSGVGSSPCDVRTSPRGWAAPPLEAASPSRVFRARARGLAIAARASRVPPHRRRRGSPGTPRPRADGSRASAAAAAGRCVRRRSASSARWSRASRPRRAAAPATPRRSPRPARAGSSPRTT